jgi:hypothetical protein
MGGRIAHRLAQLGDRRVQATVEVHEGVGRPQLLLQLLAGDNFTRTPQQ